MLTRQKLTKEEAISKHREMWEAMQMKLGDNPPKNARIEFKYLWCDTHDFVKIQNHCYLCEYAQQRRQRDENEYCKYCPINWGDIKRSGCLNNEIKYNQSPISEILSLPESDVQDDVDSVDEDLFLDTSRRVIECLRALKEITSSGCCNTCTRKKCQYRPKWGELVRYNCYFYEGDKNE